MTNRSFRSLTVVAGIAGLLVTGCASGSASAEQPGSAKAAPTAKEFKSFEEVEVHQPAADLLPASVKGKTITFGVDATAAPTKFIGSDGQTFVGLDADVARALGQVLGVNVEFSKTTFDGLIPGIQAKRFDAAIADMGVTEPRLEVLDMVGYALGGEAIAAAPGNPLDIGPDAMCGHKVAVAQGSLQAVERGPKRSEACVAAGEPAINFVTVPDQNAALLQLKSGRVEAAYADAPALSWAAKQSPDEFEKVADIPGSILSMGLIKDSELTPAFVEAMKHLTTLPAYQELTDRWGMDYAALDAETIDSYKTPPVPPQPKK